jgi:hypothetical protein
VSLQSAAPTPPYDHSPIFRGVPALITFFDQLNMATRFPKVLFTTTAPILTLLRFLSLHWSSRKHEAADAGVRDRRFDRFSFMGLPDLCFEQIGLGVGEDLSVELHMSAMGVLQTCDGSALRGGLIVRYRGNPALCKHSLQPCGMFRARHAQAPAQIATWQMAAIFGHETAVTII